MNNGSGNLRRNSVPFQQMKGWHRKVQLQLGYQGESSIDNAEGFRPVRKEIKARCWGQMFLPHILEVTRCFLIL